MNEIKPITLRSLIFSDEKGVEKVRQYYDIEFSDETIAEIFIQNQYKYFTELYGKLVFRQQSFDTLTELEIKQVLKLVSKFFKLQYRDVKSRSRKPEFVEARRMAAMICIKRKKSRSAIYEFLGIDHSNLAHHEKQFRNYCTTDPEYVKTYDECEEYVLSKLKHENDTQLH